MAVNNTGRLALNNTAYDVAKDAVTLWLPALATFYVLLAGLWDLPKPNEITGTLTGLATFLGVVLKVSTSSYNNGKLDNPDNTKVPTAQAVAIVEPKGVDPESDQESIFPDLKS